MNPLAFDFMQRAIVAAALVGLVAPLIGVFLVQRRLALLGDGMGHVALTGVGLAFLVGSAPVPTALVVAAAGAVVLELIRARSRTAGDLALALVFYGGISGGVLLASLATGASTALNQYLFGSLSTVSTADMWWLVGAVAVVLIIIAVFGRDLFLMALDSDLAHVQGVRTTAVSMLLTVLASVSVVVGMRTVGLLLVSAIMIVPVAAAQQFTRSFRSTAGVAVAIGVAASVVGLGSSFYLDTPPGPTIVILALVVFIVSASIAVPVRRLRRRAHPS